MVDKKTNDGKAVGISYIYTFYGEVASLTQVYSEYLNFKLELKYRYQSSAIDGISLDEVERERLNVLLQTFRHFSHKAIVQYKTLVPNLTKVDKKKEEKDEIIKIYEEHIKKEYLLDEDKIERFVELFNSCLLKQVIQDLLTTNQDMVASLYGSTTEQ